jgi:predicted transcriptional regulator
MVCGLTNRFGSTKFKVNHKGDRMMSAFTVRLPSETVAKLDQLAEKADRSRSYVAAQAIEDYVAKEEWQLAEIEAGLEEANRGEFASEEDLAAVIAKYIKPASGR